MICKLGVFERFDAGDGWVVPVNEHMDRGRKKERETERERRGHATWSPFLFLFLFLFLNWWSCRGSNPGPDMACNMLSTCLSFLEFRRCKVQREPVAEPELRI
jgi:hypothetical protein